MRFMFLTAVMVICSILTTPTSGQNCKIVPELDWVEATEAETRDIKRLLGIGVNVDSLDLLKEKTLSASAQASLQFGVIKNRKTNKKAIVSLGFYENYKAKRGALCALVSRKNKLSEEAQKEADKLFLDIIKALAFYNVSERIKAPKTSIVTHFLELVGQQINAGRTNREFQSYLTQNSQMTLDLIWDKIVSGEYTEIRVSSAEFPNSQVSARVQTRVKAVKAPAGQVELRPYIALLLTNKSKQHVKWWGDYVPLTIEAIAKK